MPLHNYKDGNGTFYTLGDWASRASQRDQLIQICEGEGLRKLFLRNRLVGESVEVSYQSIDDDSGSLWGLLCHGLEISVKSQSPSNPKVDNLARKIRDYCNQTWIDGDGERFLPVINEDVKLPS